MHGVAARGRLLSAAQPYPWMSLPPTRCSLPSGSKCGFLSDPETELLPYETMAAFVLSRGCVKRCPRAEGSYDARRLIRVPILHHFAHPVTFIWPIMDEPATCFRNNDTCDSHVDLSPRTSLSLSLKHAGVPVCSLVQVQAQATFFLLSLFLHSVQKAKSAKKHNNGPG